MDQARAVLDRLDRIGALKQGDAPPGVLLSEVRSLLAEAESWVEAERPGGRAEAALDRCHEALVAGERASADVLASG